MPAGEAVDIPAYAERGVGVCACYIHVSMPWLERLIKDAAYLKLNQLWLELKVKSTAHPEANEWGYYTPAQIDRLQRLADKYHITLVPEVNSPGHIDTWIRNRPDLQLTDVDGDKQPSRLDITKPEAFAFLASIIDEYFKVFDTPYWHMGADEYMLGSDYSRYPQMLAYAQEKFGPEAVAEDAFTDFVNRINAYVKAKDKTLRIWNDGTTTAGTVPLDRDIVVEHWADDEVKPSQLLAEGRSVMNSAYALYNVRGGFKTNAGSLYGEGWTPLNFDGENVADGTGITGAKITLWPDNGSGNTENEIEDEVRMPLRFTAQATWGDSTPDPTYDDFAARADAVGRAPGFDNVDRTPIRPGRYVVSAANHYLTGAGAAAGARVVLGSEGTEFRISTTPDGYYVLKDPATDRCLEARQGHRFLNTPLEPLAAITLEDCSRSNTLPRWQIATSNAGLTLTNAVTRMIAVLDGSGLVQQIPDGHRPQVFELTGVVEVGAAVTRRTVGVGESTPITVTVTNGTAAPVTGVSVSLTGTAGWTVTPAEQQRDSLAPGEAWTTTATAARTDGQATVQQPAAGREGQLPRQVN
ncbi:family 20 glycosylhydrolase [Streptomyces sp. NPDC052309]|uniref:family 20 glycosylhydrolase n=1 Tax=Streptomyces sp. NPDC052309 TaxID=3155421 RepID=UPI003426DEBF